MSMYRIFKILFIINTAVYILSNVSINIVSIKDIHAKISSTLCNSTKIKNIKMSERVGLQNIKWTLSLKVNTGQRKRVFMSSTQEEGTNKGITQVFISVDRTEEIH